MVSVPSFLRHGERDGQKLFLGGWSMRVCVSGSQARFSEKKMGSLTTNHPPDPDGISPGNPRGVPLETI